MVRSTHITLSALLLLSATLSASAAVDCTCRFKGQEIPEGQTICLSLPSGNVLAKCTKVLNNTSWKTIQKGCPVSSIEMLNWPKLS